jgi:hypothetical protein
MIHKFKDYNKNEQREIVFEIIRQKYLHSPKLNNFGDNCKWVSNVINNYVADKIDVKELKTHLETNFYNRINKKIAEEVLFYFYHIADGVIEKSTPDKAKKFSKVGEIIGEIIDIDDLNDKVEPPEDKISSIDNSGGFTMVSSGRYPSPSSYTPPPPPPPMHNFKNPYTNKDFKTICEFLRNKLFDLIIDEEPNTIEDLENISPSYLVPDSNECDTFPQVKDEDGDTEDLDFENPGDFIIDDENCMSFSGGGDWQEPLEFSMKMQNGKIKAFNIQEGYNDSDYESGSVMIMKIVCKLFGLDINDYPIDGTDPKDMARLYNDMVKNKDYKLNLNKELRTEDCVQAIVDYFPNESSDFRNPKNWKRKSKSGIASVNIYIRIFANKVTGEEVKITSSNTEIKKIEKL